MTAQQHANGDCRMAQQRSNREVYVLRHLKACGLSGQPFSNVVAGSPIPVKELYKAMKSLKEEGLIHIGGPRTLSDLKQLIEDAGDIPPPVLSDEKGRSWTGNNVLVFNEQSGSKGFFQTQVRLTLRGHAALVFEKKKPTPPQVAANAKPAKPAP